MKQLILLLLFLTIVEADRGLILKKMQEEQRIALVIGNKDYNNLSNLKNPINDARLMKNVLIERGFEVIYKENATKYDMQKLVGKFTGKLKKNGIGLYYFAGHGVSVEGENFLVGTDSLMDDKDAVPYQTLALNYLTKKMKKSGNRLNIIILDACRNDPFSDTRSSGGGLAPISNAKGLFIAYATEAGGVAIDGEYGKNGVFTKYLVKHLKESGATIEKVFKNTRADVEDKTDGKQNPAVYSQMRGDFFFTLPSSYSFDTISDSHFPLTINTTPRDAKVYIMNIDPKYYDGIRLKKGSYDIKVKRAGYLTKRGDIKLNSALNIDIVLEKERVVYRKKKEYSKEKNGFVLIKKGSFMMGSNSGDKDEKPIHRVNIDYDFYIGKYEVTFNQYDKFCDATGREKPNDDGWGRGERPVINVSWNDAKAYTKWLSKKEGTTYRLPTEAEREYVARAGTTTKYSFGDSDSSLGQYAWYSKNSSSKTHKVGQKKPNPWGVYDMYGNVWEWCEDWYVDSYKNTPRNGTDNNSDSQGIKVLRGGSWYSNSDNLRSANRNRSYPSNTYYNIGFRVVSVVHP